MPDQPAKGAERPPRPAPPKASEAAHPEVLAEALWTAARQLRQLEVTALIPWEVAPSHARALAVLLEHGPIRLSELSGHLHITPRSTTEVVDVLAQRGLAERQPDPADRRAIRVTLTRDGHRVGRAIGAARTAGVAAFFEILDEQERERLVQLLRRLHRPGH